MDAHCPAGVADGLSPRQRHEGAVEFFSQLFDTSDFPARWSCGRWTSELGWLHIISDVAIFGAYLAIPCVLAFFILRRRDVPFPRILWLFVVFIMACGIGHLIEACIFWSPMYRLSGLVKAITAVASWVTVIALIRIVPEVLKLPDMLRLKDNLLIEVRERKQIEVDLKAARRVADEANRAKSQFLANMSHEIRTPLTGILGFTDLLSLGVESDAERQEYLEIIRSSGRHLHRLIDDILDLSRIEAGRMEYDAQSCSPQSIIEEVLSVLRLRATEKNLTLTGRWRGNEPETIVTDPMRFRQLLMNLVGNAIKFTEQGHIEVVAALDFAEPEPRLAIEIHDSGIGITPEQLAKVFEPFQQADSSITRQFGGSGLGLAISRRIAQALGGGLTATSEPGQGSVFTVTLATGPLDHVRLLDRSRGECAAAASAEDQSARLAGSRILLVEDGANNRKLVTLFLERVGAVVTAVENGLLACETAESQPFDLILMDMQMPVMDGYTATRRLRDAHINVPIVALTAHAMRGDAEKCLEAGCNAHVPKPIVNEELIATMARLLDSREPSPAANAN